MSVVRRTLVLGGARDVAGLGSLQALRDLLDLCRQGLDLLLLAKNHVTQIGVGALEERYFCLQLLQ